MSSAVLYLVISFIFFSIAITLQKECERRKQQFRAKTVPWERTTAVITGISTQFIGKGRAFSPMYRYTYKGQEYRWTSSVGRGEETHRVGDTIEIVVNPVNPSESEVAVDIKLGSRTFSISDFFTGRSVDSMLLQGMSILIFAAGIVFALLALTN